MAFALRFFTCLALTVCIVASVDAAISCGTVASSLAPCVNYLSKGGVVPPPCCAGVKKLNGMAQTTPDRQQACRCLKSAAQGVNPSLASSLPGKCGVSIPIPSPRALTAPPSSEMEAYLIIALSVWFSISKIKDGYLS